MLVKVNNRRRVVALNYVHQHLSHVLSHWALRCVGQQPLERGVCDALHPVWVTQQPLYYCLQVRVVGLDLWQLDNQKPECMCSSSSAEAGTPALQQSCTWWAP